MVFHATTPKKLKRYINTGCILPPVRFWTTERSARKFMQRTGRTILVTFERPTDSYPLPIKGGAMWSSNMVRDFEW